jgi:hypothetical protein
MSERALPVRLPRSRASAHHRVGFVVAAYAYRLVASLVVALPFAVGTQSVVGRHPRGDAVLFDDGATYLLELLRVTRAALPAGALLFTLGVLVASVAGLWVFAALVLAMTSRGRWRLGSVMAEAARPLGTLVLLSGATLLAQALVWGLLAVASGVTAAYWVDEGPRGDLVKVFAVAWPGLLVIPLGVMHDLARVEVVLEGKGPLRAVAAASRAVRRRFFALLGAWTPRAAAALAAIFCAGAIATRVGALDGAAFALTLAVHQLALLFATAARASWLSAAIRLGHLAP